MADLTNPSQNSQGPISGKVTAGKIEAADGHTYHKSKSANATVAPTSGSTLSASEQTKTAANSIGEVELDFITIVDMHWGMTGQLLDNTQASELYNMPAAIYNQCIKNADVLNALVERGVDVRRAAVGDITDGAPDEWRTTGLTPIQLLVINTILDLTDTRNDRKKLQDLGVDTKTYQAWLLDDKFSEYARRRTEQLFGKSQHEAHLAIIDGMRRGNPKMTELYLEMTGKFSRRPEGPAGAFTQESAAQLIMQIIEIIVEEVNDPETGARIGDRIRTLTQSRNLANELVQAHVEPIIQPEIQPSRVLTDEIKELMHHGVGSDG